MNESKNLIVFYAIKVLARNWIFFDSTVGVVYSLLFVVWKLLQMNSIVIFFKMTQS